MKVLQFPLIWMVGHMKLISGLILMGRWYWNLWGVKKVWSKNLESSQTIFLVDFHDWITWMVGWPIVNAFHTRCNLIFSLQPCKPSLPKSTRSIIACTHQLIKLINDINYMLILKKKVEIRSLSKNFFLNYA